MQPFSQINGCKSMWMHQLHHNMFNDHSLSCINNECFGVLSMWHKMMWSYMCLHGVYFCREFIFQIWFLFLYFLSQMNAFMQMVRYVFLICYFDYMPVQVATYSGLNLVSMWLYRYKNQKYQVTCNIIPQDMIQNSSIGISFNLFSQMFLFAFYLWAH